METPTKPRAWMTLERTVNLGNYNSAKVSVGVAFDEDTTSEEIMKLVQGEQGQLAYSVLRSELAKRIQDAKDDADWSKVKAS